MKLPKMNRTAKLFAALALVLMIATPDAFAGSDDASVKKILLRSGVHVQDLTFLANRLSSLAMENGAFVENEVDNEIHLNENSEDLTLAFGTNTLTFDSGTAATYIFTPAVAMTGDLTLSGAAGALTFDTAASSVVVVDASTTGLVIGAAGELSMITLNTTDDAEEVLVAATTGFRSAHTEITGAVTLDASDCGKDFGVTAGIDTFSITLPDADAVIGCRLAFMYTGADAGALLDITPLDTDADGIEGGCYETATDTIIYFSGTADEDVGLTKTTGLTGDMIELVACSASQWCVKACVGIWANN